LLQDHERFLGLLAPHQSRLVAISRQLIGRKCDADDALQEAVLKAWAGFAAYSEERHFGAWILAYLVNVIRNRNRRLYRELETPLPEELPAPEVLLDAEVAYERLLEAPEALLETLDEELARALRALSPAERLVLLLRAVGELSYREISRVLAIPEGTAMSHLFRARKRLRILLSSRAPEKQPERGERA
jgi:RNA polymerase sigma-70 factor (ECF subfamily)